MTTIVLQDGTKLSMFGGIMDLPASNYTDFRANELLAAGIGNIYANLERSMVAIGEEKNDVALTELQNAYVGLKHTEAGHDAEQLQFAWCVAAVGDKPIVAKTAEERQQLMRELGEHGLTQQMVTDFVEEIKKKLNPN